MNIVYKILRVFAIVLVGLAAVFNLASGAGTTCVALAAEKYGPKMAAIAPFQWLYVLFVIATLGIGVLLGRATWLLVKGRQGATRAALLALLAGVVVGGVHMAVSRALRGSSMPVDGVVYATALALVVLALLRLPGVRHGVDFERPGGDPDLSRQAAAVTLWAGAALVLTVQYWAGPTHMLEGVNYADVWHTPMLILGGGLLFAGAALLVWPRSRAGLAVVWRRVTAPAHQTNVSS